VRTSPFFERSLLEARALFASIDGRDALPLAFAPSRAAPFEDDAVAVVVDATVRTPSLFARGGGSGGAVGARTDAGPAAGTGGGGAAVDRGPAGGGGAAVDRGPAGGGGGGREGSAGAGTEAGLWTEGGGATDAGGGLDRRVLMSAAALNNSRARASAFASEACSAARLSHFTASARSPLPQRADAVESAQWTSSSSLSTGAGMLGVIGSLRSSYHDSSGRVIVARPDCPVGQPFGAVHQGAARAAADTASREATGPFAAIRSARRCPKKR
jgi:hypothetical protein